uniref:Ribosomal protein S18 n=1 Tax=Cryptomonas sp. CCAC 1634B TaxID=2051848 RepID=A0A679C9X7_9CRYP|nr:ribosomal protein S18 [Cryptomonas sp. CCAC 1634B]
MAHHSRVRSPLAITANITHSDVELLCRFLTEHGKIIPRRTSGLMAKQQTKLAKAIKRARIMALLPFVAKEL